MLLKGADSSNDSQRFLSDENSDQLQSLESATLSENSRGNVPDRHWNSRTIDDDRRFDRTEPIGEGRSHNSVLEAERHHHAAGAHDDEFKEIGGNMGLEATVRSRLGTFYLSFLSVIASSRNMMPTNTGCYSAGT